VKIKGADRLARKFIRMDQGSREAVVKGLNRWAVTAHREVVKSISAKGGGVPSQKASPKRVHAPSVPGQPPATDLGGLRQGVLIHPATFQRPFAFVISTAKYSAWLEYGTRHILPRPFMGPAFMKTAPGALKDIQSLMKRGLKA